MGFRLPPSPLVDGSSFLLLLLLQSRGTWAHRAGAPGLIVSGFRWEKRRRRCSLEEEEEKGEEEECPWHQRRAKRHSKGVKCKGVSRTEGRSDGTACEYQRYSIRHAGFSPIDGKKGKQYFSSSFCVIFRFFFPFFLSG